MVIKKEEPQFFTAAVCLVLFDVTMIPQGPEHRLLRYSQHILGAIWKE